MKTIQLMIHNLLDKIKENKKIWDQLQNVMQERSISSKTVLLEEGEIASDIYFIKKGCLRQSFNKDGKDITFQFFFEGQSVASIDSFIYNKPSLFSIESIESCLLLSVKKEKFKAILSSEPEFKDGFQDFILQRMRNYSQLFLSRIKDSPQERYIDLMENHPEIIKRIPQHYIASYLGITPISLSRIKNRKKV